MTNKDAPLYKVATIDLADPELKIVDLITEDPEAPLENARMVDGDKFALVYKRNVSFCPYIGYKTNCAILGSR